MIPPTPPEAPGLALTVGNCSINVLITNNAKNAYGLYVYRLDPSGKNFQRIATLAPNSSGATPIKYTDSKLFGSFSYYVSAFNASGETPSPISQTQITDVDCKTPFWIGLNLQIITSPPTSAKYDKAYFYLGVNNQDWGRVPKDPGLFLDLQNGVFDVNQQITANVPPPTQGKETVVLDAWGWQGGLLVHIGTFIRTFYGSSGNGGQPPDPGSGMVKLEVCSQPTANCSQYQASAKFGPYAKVAFRWSAQPGAAGIYQVWSSSLGESGNCPLNDTVLRTGLVGEVNGSNTFTIDFTNLNTTATSFSVRVLALNSNGQSACEPSNIVPVNFSPPPKGQMADPYVIQIDTVDPGQLPNLQKPGCIVVTKNDGSIPYAPVGTEICPQPYVPPDDPCADSFSLKCAEWTAEQIGSGLVNGADQLSQDFGSAKGWVVGNIEGVIPGCSGDNTCDSIVSHAVDAGLVELGIPPSVPNSDELKKGLVSYAADQTLDQIGLSCKDPNNPCDALLQMGHDAAKQKLTDAFNSALEQNAKDQMAHMCISDDQAHAEGIDHAICIPPDQADHIQIAPAPDSAGAPTLVTLQIARDPSVPDSALPDSYSCSFKIHSSAVNDTWIGQQIYLGSNPDPWNGEELTDTQNIHSPGLFNESSESIPSGIPFAQVSGGNGGFSGGIQVPVVLNPSSATFDQNGDLYAGWWIKDHWQYDYYVLQPVDPSEGGALGDHDDWPYLFRGADATFTVTESCTSSNGSFQDAPKAQQTIHINK